MNPEHKLCRCGVLKVAAPDDRDSQIGKLDLVMKGRDNETK